ncbi:MAG: hypothetical protein ACRD2Y_06535 [Terriglobales bacterium]
MEANGTAEAVPLRNQKLTTKDTKAARSRFQLQLKVAVPTTSRPPFASSGNMAVTVTGLVVEPRHETVPKVSSCALLTMALTGSETDQVTRVRFEAVEVVAVVVEQLPLMEMPTAENTLEFPGGGTVESAVVL